MDNINRIMVVSRSTKGCQKAVQTGISLARKYSAELIVLHVVHDPFSLGGWNLPIASLEKEYAKLLETARNDIEEMVRAEQAQGMAIKEVIREGDPLNEVLKMVADERVDLLVMLAHEEGRIEHFLFGRANEALVRKMPCSIVFVKKELERVE